MKLADALWKGQERMSGATCFRGTRVPVSILFQHLEAGQLDDFFYGYPNVSREQVHAVLESSQKLIEEQLETAA